MAEFKWIKIVADIFDDEKMLLIESMPECDTIIVIWFKLLCMAGKQNNGGVFMLNDKIAYTDEMLAQIFRRPLNTVRLALTTFEKYGMVEIINETITIPKWEKHQNVDGYNLSKEATRKRVARYREKQKKMICDTDVTLRNVTCNVTVTECNGNRNRKEIEIEKEIDSNKKEKKKTASGYDVIICGYTQNEDLKTALFEFIKMRKLIKCPMTDRALKQMISKLDSLGNCDGEKIAILDQSIVNSWKGVFPLKEPYRSPETLAKEIRPMTDEEICAALGVPYDGGD